jgi:hypothetical protein
VIAFTAAVRDEDRAATRLAGFQSTSDNAAGLLQPCRADSADSKLKVNKRTQLDRLYQKVLDDLEELVDAGGFKAA